MEELPRRPKAYPLRGNLTHLMVSKNLDPIPAAVDPEDPQNQVANGGGFWSPWNFRQVTAPNTNQLGLFESRWPIQADAFQTLLDMGFA